MSITLQFASNNSHIVQNSETIANKGKTNSRLEFSKSLEVPNNDQRLVKMLIWLKSSNGVSSKKKKTPDSVHIFKVEGIWHINELKNEWYHFLSYKP